MAISVDIQKKLGNFSLRVRFDSGDETLALLGASGCGKSMTLKCIAGIETPDRGRIVLDGVTLFDSEKHINLPPQERHVGLMFQNYALFPNMTLRQNLAAGARREKNQALREQAIDAMLRQFELTKLSGLYPHQLSGGQQQRLALARLLISHPDILLLDEPFSALDSHLRFRMEQELRSTLQQFGKTVILVSHDRDEVYRMADTIAVMHEGTITALGKKKELFANPVTRTGAVLTGCKNISAAEVLQENRVLARDWGLELATGPLPPELKYIGIRMHDLSPEGGENPVWFRVVGESENPFSVTVLLEPKETSLAVPIGWETEKETWNRLRSPELRLYLPKSKLLLLRED